MDDIRLDDVLALYHYDRSITFIGERVSRREQDGTETEISREVYQAERAAAEARQNAARAARKAANEVELAALQAERAELEPAIARLRGKRKITLAEHDALNQMEERYQRVCIDEACARDALEPKSSRWPTPLDISRDSKGKIVVKRSQR